MTATTGAPSIFEAGLPALEYDVTESPHAVRDRIRAAQRRAPIAIGPFGPEVLSYDLARNILRDTRFIIPPGLHLSAQGVTSGPLWDRVVGSIICAEGAEHHRLRSLVSRAFTPRAIARLDETIGEVITELIDKVAPAGRCDVVTDIARHYPIPIICALLGAPRADWTHFDRWAEEIFKMVNFSVNLVDEMPAVLRGWAELDAYVDEMVADRRQNLTDDLLSNLIRAEDDGDRLNADELRLTVAGLLLAGTDTTRNQLAASMQVLVDHPEQWALLRDQPELATSAVEESMRHSPAVCNTVRTVNEDVELGGYSFPGGTYIFVNSFAANRDPDIYPDPDRFDITRKDAPAVLTFGGGVHYCLGANLARLELAEGLKILARRIPDARRAGPAPWKPMLGMSGPTSLPIEFGSRR
ncbi:cytochrome [Mycobacterium florentinum]|uniref:Cytochrome n=1 Tax=Mycobacterium florentinum TaxID=292462 RepID=A0A1X1UGD3_MYCFL|nr:cytochrome P450 [Mycobacterium florentinum]MCV7412989.1 cytochrome P450 [Mycobacterium florentinum]ORV55880.1 cytochrome [Mycobacterium florentinum]BBX76506.1 cytochrome P450 hydroxylase [Mycobacterium florentinum]